MSYFIWLFVYALLSFLLGYILRPFRYTRTFKLVFLPGTVVWGLAMNIACLFSGTERKRSTYFWAEGPIVEHDESPVKYLGPMILAALPFLLCTLAFGVTEHRYGGHGDEAFPFPLESEAYAQIREVEATTASIRTIPPRLATFVKGSLQAFADAPWRSPWTWLYFYLAASFILTASPSTKSMLPLTGALGILLIPVWLFDWLGGEITFDWFSRGWYLSRQRFVPKCLADLVALTLTFVLATTVLAGLAHLIQRSSEEEERQ